MPTHATTPTRLLRARPLAFALAFALACALVAVRALEAQRAIRETAAQWSGARALVLTPVQRWCAEVDAPGCDFRAPASVRATPDGGLLASDIGGPLRLFNAKGAFVRQLGRKGQGPGEYGFVIDAHVASDGYVTWFDNTQMRLASVSLDGRPGPTRRLNPPSTMSNLFVVDTMLVVFDVPAHATRGSQVTGVFRTVPMSGAARTLATVRTPSVFLPGSDMFPPSTPFAPRVTSHVGSGGDVVHGDGRTYAFDVFPVRGTRWRLDVDLTPRAVTSAERDSARAAALRAFKVQRLADLPVGVRDGYVSLPSTHPPVDRAVLLADGTLCVRPTPPARASRARWDIFTRDGVRVGQISLPIAAHLRDGTRDWLLTSEPNADDLPTFVRYRISQ